MCAYMSAYMYMCLYVCIPVCAHMPVYLSIYTCFCVYTCMYICFCIRTCVNIYMNDCVYGPLFSWKLALWSLSGFRMYMLSLLGIAGHRPHLEWVATELWWPWNSFLGGLIALSNSFKDAETCLSYTAPSKSLNVPQAPPLPPVPPSSSYIWHCYG